MIPTIVISSPLNGGTITSRMLAVFGEQKIDSPTNFGPGIAFYAEPPIKDVSSPGYYITDLNLLVEVCGPMDKEDNGHADKLKAFTTVAQKSSRQIALKVINIGSMWRVEPLDKNDVESALRYLKQRRTKTESHNIIENFLEEQKQLISQ